MQDRQLHRQEVQAFLHEHLGGAGAGGSDWDLTLPHGWGQETYFARCGAQACFIKLGARIPRYRAMAALGLTPEVIATGQLGDGTPVLVQAYVDGRTPTRADYRTRLEQFAAIIRTTHHSPQVRQALPGVTCNSYREIGLETLAHIRQRWQRYRPQVPQVAGFIDDSLAQLERQVEDFQGTGLVASHNDICNANWLLTPGGRLYLIDLDDMALEDPALDIGATLWWYYPPELRSRFLELCGYPDEEAFHQRMCARMRTRMAMHCLHILLPRQGSFDRFDPAAFPQALVDFRAALAGKENPQGYDV
jgi:thiamine kinase-like enzyme